jgi:hypothetical protein
MMARKPKPPLQKRSRPTESVRRDEDEETAEARRQRSGAPTLPPPPVSGKEATETRTSTIRPRKRTATPVAAVDEVTADLTRDPRRER